MMKRRTKLARPFRIVLGHLMCVAIIVSACPGAGAKDKMPVSTTSKKALGYYQQGLELTDKLRNQEARQYFQNAVAEDPDFAIAYLQLALTQPSALKFQASLDKATALADKASEAERLWIQGVEAAAVRGDLAEQQSYYQKLVKLYPDDERAHNLLGNNYFAIQEWELAVGEYEQSTQINPDFSQPYNQMGYALRFLGRYEEAVKVFRKYIELIPEDPNPYDSYAELLMKMGRYDESIEQYQAALGIRSDFVNAYTGIASNLNFQGKHAEARTQLQKMYDIAKDDGQRRFALTTMATSYIDEGDFDRALEELDKLYAIAEAIGDTSAMAGDLVLMGFTLIEVRGREQEALDKFEEATAMVQASSLSDDTKAANRRGHFFNASRAYIAMGDLEKARKNADKFRALAEAIQNPNLIRTAHQLDGFIALKEGQFDLAIKELTQTNQLNPYNLFFIGKAYEGKGDLAKARDYYKQAANFNGLNNIPQSCIRLKAAELAAGA